MKYVEGFVCAVPAANRDIYRKHAVEAFEMIKEYGVTRMVETWGDEVPAGELTDFHRAVKAQPDEVVVFSWFEYPSREVRDEAGTRMMSDPRMKNIAASMPFDGKRMIYGGFAVLVEEGASPAPMGYTDGSLLAVPAANKEAYRAHAAEIAVLLKQHGAARVVEAWGDDVPDGTVTDFKGAVNATDDETVVYCWVEWRSKADRDAAWGALMSDARLFPDGVETLYDGRRRVHGGFTPILDM